MLTRIALASPIWHRISCSRLFWDVPVIECRCLCCRLIFFYRRLRCGCFRHQWAFWYRAKSGRVAFRCVNTRCDAMELRDAVGD